MTIDIPAKAGGTNAESGANKDGFAVHLLSTSEGYEAVTALHPLRLVEEVELMLFRSLPTTASEPHRVYELAANVVGHVKRRLYACAKQDADWRLVRINDLPLSARLKHVCHQQGFDTLGAAASLTQPQWLRTPNFGRKSFNELKRAILSLGGNLPETWTPPPQEEAR